ncbi:MAG TPA: c-type cytochrome, partial [Thermoanaerobaculia bacterium]|nr:c-type cytochrome [Thermoanaerobaculia bacterium]
MRLVENLGCWGCHRIDGLERQPLPKVGPSLEKVASKAPRDWSTRWVMDPASFRPNTKMPTFFYQENFVDVSGPRPPTAAQKKMNTEGRIENDTMVNAIVAYLYEKARPAEVPAVSGRGDPVRGQKLLADRGCYGCHLVDPRAQRDLIGTYRQFGPNLAGEGSKASRDWIYHWVRNPKDWNPDTKMPNLRLTHEDALDIAEYLASLKAPAGFDAAALPRTDPKVLEQIALYFEMSTKTLFDAKAELAAMDQHAREVYAGKNLIAHYGCYACHAIPGFEDAKPIGTELTEEGSKAVHRLDFGFIHLPHTRQDWFRTKLHAPRIYDRDRARGWEEKLRMPNFRFTDRELDVAVTAVLGFQQLNASPSVVKELSPSESAIERGRRIVPVARRGRLAGAPDHPGGRGEGAERLALRLPARAEDGPDPSLAGSPHADFRLQRRRAQRPDALLRLARPRRVSVPGPGRRDRSGELGGRQEGVRAAQVRAVPSPVARRHEPARRRSREPRAEPSDGLDAPAPRLDRGLDPPSGRMDAGDEDADELPEGGRRAAAFPARRPAGCAQLREGPRRVREALRHRRGRQAVPEQPRGRHQGPARLRLVDRHQRRRRSRARPREDGRGGRGLERLRRPRVVEAARWRRRGRSPRR